MQPYLAQIMRCLLFRPTPKKVITGAYDTLSADAQAAPSPSPDTTEADGLSLPHMGAAPLNAVSCILFPPMFSDSASGSVCPSSSVNGLVRGTECRTGAARPLLSE